MFSILGLFSVWPFLPKVYLVKSKIWPFLNRVWPFSVTSSWQPCTEGQTACGLGRSRSFLRVHDCLTVLKRRKASARDFIFGGKGGGRQVDKFYSIQHEK